MQENAQKSQNLLYHISLRGMHCKRFQKQIVYILWSSSCNPLHEGCHKKPSSLLIQTCAADVKMSQHDADAKVWITIIGVYLVLLLWYRNPGGNSIRCGFGSGCWCNYVGSCTDMSKKVKWFSDLRDSARGFREQGEWGPKVQGAGSMGPKRPGSRGQRKVI